VVQPLAIARTEPKAALDPLIAQTRLMAAAPLIVAVAAAVVAVSRGRQVWPLLAWVATALGLGVASTLVFRTQGSASYSLQYFVAGALVCLAALLHVLGRSDVARAGLAAAVIALYATTEVVPPPAPEASRRFEQTLDRLVRRYEGRVLIPGRPEALVRAGYPLHYHHTMLRGLVGRGDKLPLPAAISAALDSGRWRAVLDWEGGIAPVLEQKKWRLVRQLGRDPRIGSKVALYERPP
jgi:hypothetical protein